MRDFISAAAASVNVTTSSSSTSHGSLASQTRCAHRSASTAVLPEPAAADTRRLLPTVVIPAHCSRVQEVEEELPPTFPSRSAPCLLRFRVGSRPLGHNLQHLLARHRL